MLKNCFWIICIFALTSAAEVDLRNETPAEADIWYDVTAMFANDGFVFSIDGSLVQKFYGPSIEDFDDPPVGFVLNYSPEKIMGAFNAGEDELSVANMAIPFQLNGRSAWVAKDVRAFAKYLAFWDRKEF